MMNFILPVLIASLISAAYLGIVLIVVIQHFSWKRRREQERRMRFYLYGRETLRPLLPRILRKI